MKQVLVLGASGFVGRRLVAELSRKPEIATVAGQRRPLSPKSEGIEIRLGDFTHPDAVRGALRDIDQVVNCLGGPGTAELKASKWLFAAAREFGIRRVVQISSMAVYGDAYGQVDEATPLPTAINSYAASKIACEALANSYSRLGGDVVILRPSCVYGPQSEQWTGRIGRLLRAGRIGDLGPAGDGFANLVHIDDLVAAILSALAQPSISGETFNISSPDIPTWNGYFARFATALGNAPLRRISSRRIATETKLLAPALKLGTLVSQKITSGRHKSPEPISPSLAKLWRQEIHLDHSKADAVLGFPRTELSSGIQSAAAWFIEREKTS